MVSSLVVKALLVVSALIDEELFEASFPDEACIYVAGGKGDNESVELQEISPDISFYMKTRF